MAYLSYKGIGITGMAAAVPKKVINNYEYTKYFPENEVKEVVDKIGVFERRFADEYTTAADLGYAAAEQLISKMTISRDSIDVLLFVSQTPDYKMPATSVILQEKLGLAKSTLAFDINMGCSGYIHGLSVAYSYLQQEEINKVLLIDAETRSKVYSPKDRKTAFIFGDAAVATIIEKKKYFDKGYFSINSDGSRAHLIRIDAGGYRNPSSPETLKEKVVDEHGNIRSDEHGYMDGADVFNFLIREVPKDIKSILEKSGIENESIDFWIFHQANQYMNQYLAKKLKLKSDVIPTSIEKFGNTSSVSIPLTMVYKLSEELQQPKKLLLSGFGVGMAWASAILNTDVIFIPEIIEV
jgi:3-oxoacyl-[acyl-carrier-protein] synthase-3